MMSSRDESTDGPSLSEPLLYARNRFFPITHVMRIQNKMFSSHSWHAQVIKEERTKPLLFICMKKLHLGYTLEKLVFNLSD